MSSAKRSRNDGALAAGDSNASKKPKVNGSITSFFGAPKPAAASGATTGTNAVAAAPKFNKEKWVAGLTPEQRQFLNLEIETMDPSWLAVLKDEITTPQFIELKKFLDREAGSGKKLFPPREDIYSWSRHTPFHTVKCVIVGQDPYHNLNQAHGLAFSVRPPIPAPPSLRNIYKALERDYPDVAQFAPPPKNGGLLTPWAERGVLLLNTCLTVRAHEPNSHANRGWERLTQRAIDLVAQRRAGRGVVFLAWGTPAGKRVQKVDRTRHLVLQSVHPSPLSANRGGWFDCGHFRKTNEWLAARYGPGAEIDWNLNPDALKWANIKPAAATAAADGGNDDDDDDDEKKKTTSDGTSKLASPVKTAKKQQPAKEEKNYDDDDDDEDALAAAADAAAAEAKAEAEAKAKVEAEAAEKPADDKAGDEAEAEAETVPPPVVVVDQVQDDKPDEKKVEETSKLLDEAGENSTAVEAELEPGTETEPEAKVEPEVEPEARAEADSKAADDDEAEDKTKAEATAKEAEKEEEKAEGSK